MAPGWRAGAARSRDAVMAILNGELDERAMRRKWLVVIQNPAPWHDTLVGWSGTLADGRSLAVEYVPDRLVLAAPAFAAYLEALGAVNWPSLEAVVTAVLDDLNNQLVPRWVRVCGGLSRGEIRHHVAADDRQPGWDNPVLLAAPG